MVAHVADQVVVHDDERQRRRAGTGVDQCRQRARALDAGRHEQVRQLGLGQREVVTDQVHHDGGVEAAPVARSAPTADSAIATAAALSSALGAAITLS